MRLEQVARKLFGTLLDVLAPQRCAACEALGPRSFGLLSGVQATPSRYSRRGLPYRARAGFRGARATQSSSPPRFIASSTRASPELSRVLASLAVRGIDLLGIEASDVWVPVPLLTRCASRASAATINRLLVGGTNFRAQPVAQSTHDDCVACGTPSSRPNAIDAAASQNVAHAFAARDRANARRVVLVDDVVTTGATLGGCIAALPCAAGDEVVEAAMWPWRPPGLRASTT